MTDDRARTVFRRGLAPLLDGVPEGPEWEELSSPRAKRGTRVGRWIAPMGAAAAVAIFVALMMLVDEGEPAPTGPGADAFDAAAAAEAGEEWWRAVIADDIEGAIALAHPDGEFNYVGLRQIVVGLAIETVSIERRVFGTDLQPQLCYMLTGTHGAEPTGSMVFRQNEGQWLLWEVRTNTEGCSTGTGLVTTTTEPPTGPSRTPSVVTALPVTPAVPIRVLAVRPNNPSLAILDFEVGTMTVYRPRAHALPLDAVDGAVAAPNGDLIIWTQGVARLFTDTLAAVETELGPVDLRQISGFAPALRVVPSPDGDLVWVVQPGLPSLGSSRPDYPTLVELVALPSGERLASYEVDPNAFPIGATTSGLVLNTETLIDTGDGWISEPASEQILHLLLDGTLVNLFQGHAIAVTPSAVAILNGERLVIGSADGGGSHDIPKPGPGAWDAVGGPGIPSDAMPLQTVSPDGSMLLVALIEAPDVNGTPAKSTLFVVDLETNVTTTIDHYEGPPPLATWSRDGQWIVLIDNRDIELISRTDPQNRFTLPSVVPEEHWVLAAG